MQETSPAERRIGLFILSSLAVIVLAFLVEQRTPHPALAALPAPGAATPAADELPVPDGLVALDPGERYDAKTLSDKIDGRAELYLQAGFVSLRTRRLGVPGQPERWLELMVYAMASPTAAYAVFSGQRREGARPLRLGQEAYMAENAGFLVQNSRYVEAVAAQSGMDEAVQRALASVATIGSMGAAATPASGPELLPAEGQVAGSLALLKDDAFGFDRWDDVYIAAYSNEAGRGQLFVSRRTDEAQARELAAAYRAFVLENGGEALEPPVLAWFGSYEAVVPRGRLVVGVHEASSAAWARQALQTWPAGREAVTP